MPTATSMMLNKLRMQDIAAAYGTAVPISTRIFNKLLCVCMLAPRAGWVQGSSVSISWEGPPIFQTD
jgi:hypothetical protein